jgi:hypothetical protein
LRDNLHFTGRRILFCPFQLRSRVFTSDRRDLPGLSSGFNLYYGRYALLINASYKPADFIVRKASETAFGMKLVMASAQILFKKKQISSLT